MCTRLGLDWSLISHQNVFSVINTTCDTSNSKSNENDDNDHANKNYDNYDKNTTVTSPMIMLNVYEM